jgi:hypothetical protein
MAVPTFRAAGAAVFSANNVANPTSLSPATPAGTVAGDLLVIVTCSRSISATVSTPSGWTLPTGFPKSHGTTSGGRIYVFTRIADGSATDSPTLSWSGVTTGTTGDSCSARMLGYQNVQNALDGTVQSTAATSTTSITLPAYTTGTDQTLVLGIALKISDTSQTCTVASPYVERSDDSTQTGTGHVTEVSEEVKSPSGSVAATTVTPSSTTSSLTLAVTVGLLAVAGSTYTKAGFAVESSP